MLSVVVYSASGLVTERDRKESSRSSMAAMNERTLSGNGSPSTGGGFFAADRYSIGTESSDAVLSQINPVLVVKYNGTELLRTSVSSGTSDPVWNEELHFNLEDVFSAETERENQRLFFFEYLDVEIWDYGRTKLCETAVPMIDIEDRQKDRGGPHAQGKVYKLVQPLHQARRGADDMGYVRLALRLKTLDVNLRTELRRSRRALLSEIYPPDTFRQYRHLFSLFDWSPADMYGCSPLAGSALGETVYEKHECVEWLVAAGQNPFGDRYTVRVTGSLLLTDLRILFLPKRVDAPPWLQLPILSYTHDPQSSAAGWGVNCEVDMQVSSGEALLIKRLTYQMPLPAIQDFTVTPVDTGSGGGGCCRIGISSRDGSTVDFSVFRMQRRARGVSHRRSVYHNHNHSAELSSMERSIFESYSGLASDSMSPQRWCNRLHEQLKWFLRENRTWVRWMQYLSETHRAFCGASDPWLKKSRAALSVELEYHRMLKPFNSWCDSWTLHDVNHRYMLCETYPQILALPSVLDLGDIEAAASQRSKGRLPALVWLHPITKVPLCRAAQPLSGLSGRLATEADVKMCLAIKHYCPTGRQLRIADARPKLNANANALAGKGFENIAAYGGHAAVQLAFLDIENIHVMRQSLIKLQDGFRSSCSGSAADLQDVYVASKWPLHVSLILRGASSIAESVLLGHPVLVHCSDGWDRTAQLSALAQLALDPHYRTVDGFFALIEKEFCAFGHKFEERLGDNGSKESSPVFLQFLDACYQLLSQYPAHFEFTPNLLVLAMQASYSGYFSTFLGNSEAERHLLVKEVVGGEGLPPDMAHLSCLAAYAGLLARSEATNTLFVNPFYVPPAHSREIAYLRPRFGVMDIACWKEGLSGINQSYLHGSLGLSSPSPTECGAVAAAIGARKDEYVRLHLPELAESTRGRYNAISSFQASLLTAKSVHGVRNALRVLSYRGHSYSSQVMSKSRRLGLLEGAAAAERLQLWLLSLRRAAAAAAALGSSSRGVARSLQVLCLSELKAAKASAALIANLHVRAVSEVVEDLLAVAFDRCMQIEELRYTHFDRLDEPHFAAAGRAGSVKLTAGPQIGSGLIKSISQGVQKGSKEITSAKSNILAAQSALKDSLMQRWNAFTAPKSHQAARQQQGGGGGRTWSGDAGDASDSN